MLSLHHDRGVGLAGYDGCEVLALTVGLRVRAEVTWYLRVCVSGSVPVLCLCVCLCSACGIKASATASSDCVQVLAVHTIQRTKKDGLQHRPHDTLQLPVRAATQPWLHCHYPSRQYNQTRHHHHQYWSNHLTHAHGEHACTGTASEPKEPSTHPQSS